MNVLLEFQEDPHTSRRRVAQAEDISIRSVGRILKTHKYHPYKIHLVQELTEFDFDLRVEFCELIMQRYDDNPMTFFWTCFSDEAKFELDGNVNRHNSRYWSDANPHWMRDSHTQWKQKINVWAGIFRHQIVGPFFFDENLTAERYLRLLQEEIVPALRGIVGNQFNLVNFQQDGAPGHFGRQVRAYLDATFPGRWIGRRGEIEWPPRSPDLTPLDFFYWGYLKDRVYQTKPDSIDDLRGRILETSNAITPEMIADVLETFYQRLAHCQTVEGAQFEHLIK